MPDWPRYYGESDPTPPSPGYRIVHESWIVKNDNTSDCGVKTIRTGVQRYEIWINQGGKSNRPLVYQDEDVALQAHRASANSLASTIPDATVHEIAPGKSNPQEERG